MILIILTILISISLHFLLLSKNVYFAKATVLTLVMLNVAYFVIGYVFNNGIDPFFLITHFNLSALIFVSCVGSFVLWFFIRKYGKP